MINPFVKNKTNNVGNNNDSKGTFKIHPFGQDMIILNENGLILGERLYIETRPFHQKPSIQHKCLCIIFIFLRVPMTSNSFGGLFSLHNYVHTIKSCMFIHVSQSVCSANCS